MISLILALALVGCILWLIETYIPMDPAVKMLIRIIVVVVVVYYLLALFGVADIPLPHVKAR